MQPDPQPTPVPRPPDAAGPESQHAYSPDGYPLNAATHAAHSAAEAMAGVIRGLRTALASALARAEVAERERDDTWRAALDATAGCDRARWWASAWKRRAKLFRESALMWERLHAGVVRERDFYQATCIDLGSRLTAADTDRARMREALEKYGRHGFHCKSHDRWSDVDYPCDCGFTAALPSPSSEPT